MPHKLQDAYFTLLTTPASTDLLYAVSDPSGTPADRKITFAALNAALDHDELTNVGTNTHADIDSALSTLSGAVISLDGRLDTAESELVTLDGRLDTAETDIDTLESTVSTHTSDLTSLDGRVDALEAAPEVSDGDKGDISVSSGTWTIDNGVVTYAKLQNVTAYGVLCRNANSSGVPTAVGMSGTEAGFFGYSLLAGELGFATSSSAGIAYITASGNISIGSVSTILNLLAGAASGDIIYRNGSTWTVLPIGTNGHVLTVASSLPSWAAASGGGGSGTSTGLAISIASNNMNW